MRYQENKRIMNHLKLLALPRVSLFAISNIIPIVDGLILVPILTRSFTPELYGELFLLLVIISFGANVAHMNILRGLMKGFFEGGKKERFAVSGFAACSIMATVVAIFFIFFWNYYFNNYHVVNVSLNSLIALSLLHFLMALKLYFRDLLTVTQNPIGCIIWEAGLSIFKITIIVGVFLFSSFNSIFDVIHILFISNIVFLPVGFFLNKKMFLAKPTYSSILEVIGIVLPRFPGLVVQWSSIALQIISIKYFFGSGMAGLIAPVLKTAAAYTVIPFAFFQSWVMTIINHQFNSENFNKMIKKRTDQYILTILPVSFVVYLFATNLLQVILPVQYHEFLPFLFPIFISLSVNQVVSFFEINWIGSKSTYKFSFVSILCLAIYSSLIYVFKDIMSIRILFGIICAPYFISFYVSQKITKTNKTISRLSHFLIFCSLMISLIFFFSSSFSQ